MIVYTGGLLYGPVHSFGYIFSFVHVIYTFISILIFETDSIPITKFILLQPLLVLLPRFVEHRTENRLD